MRTAISGFLGAMPRVTDYGVPENVALHATNCKMVSGEVRGIHTLTLLKDFADPGVKYAFRIPGAGAGGADLWLSFTSLDAFIARSPIVNDSFDRYYWHQPGQPLRYAPLATLQAGWNPTGPYLLGIPGGVATPVVTAGATGTGDMVERSYTYTFVSAYGEEGPPAPPSDLFTHNDNGMWHIAGMDTVVPDAAQRNIVSKNIYRTVNSATGNSEFYFVATIPLAQATYDDSEPDLNVASLGRNLISTMWQPPPADMEGVTSFPGGVLLGWKDKTVYMSVPYRPWAWPVQFQVSVEQPIIGIGVTGNVAVCCTQGHPQAITMTTPDSAALQKIEAPEPCLSRGSIVGSPDGVFYATQNGLMVFGPAGFGNATKDMITKEEWLKNFNPYTLRACRYQTQFIGITYPGVGYIINFETPPMTITELTDLQGAVNIFNDIWSGEVYLLSNGRVFKWDDALGAEVTWRWASKRFFTPYEVNFGAARIGTKAKFYENLPPIPDTEPMARIYLPGTGNDGAPFNVIPVLPVWAAFGLRVYADGALIYDRWVRTSRTLKLPSGLKSQDWQFEVYGRFPMAKFEFAETAKELATV